MKKYHNSEFFKWQEEYGKQKIKEGKMEIIRHLLKSMNPKEISEKTGIPLSEIDKIAEN